MKTAIVALVTASSLGFLGGLAAHQYLVKGTAERIYRTGCLQGASYMLNELNSGFTQETIEDLDAICEQRGKMQGLY